MKRVFLLSIFVGTLSLPFGGSALVSAHPGDPGPDGVALLARNDRSPGGERGEGDSFPAQKVSKSKEKGPKEAKGKGLDKAAMNQVRNAYKFLEQGKPEKALQELEKARRMAPDNYWVNYYSAGAYHQLKDYRRARQFWGAAEGGAENQEQRSRVRTAQAFTDFVDGGADQARASLRVALDMDGGNVRARELLAEVNIPARPGQPQVGARLQLGDLNSFLAYFRVPMP